MCNDWDVARLGLYIQALVGYDQFKTFMELRVSHCISFVYFIFFYPPWVSSVERKGHFPKLMCTDTSVPPLHLLSQEEGPAP